MMTRTAALSLALLCLAAAVLTGAPQPASAKPASAKPRPSFDCAKAQGQVERLICKQPELAELDARLGALYPKVLAATPPADRPRVIAAQRVWLDARDALCVAPNNRAPTDNPLIRDPAACLARMYRQRLEVLPSRATETLVHLSAVSRTAQAFMGDILFSPSAIVMSDGGSLELRLVRIEPPGNPEVFYSKRPIEVYRIVGAGPLTVLRGNAVCSSKGAPTEPTYLAISRPKVQTNSAGDVFQDVHIAIADTPDEPSWDAPDLESKICGSFFYYDPKASVTR